MLNDMPDMVDEVLAWRPGDYRAHFNITKFRDRDLAVEAYEAAPEAVRREFDAGCAEVEAAIRDVQRRLRRHPDQLSDAAAFAPFIYELIAAVGGVINGGGTLLDNSAALLAADAQQGQAEVDALFD